MSTSKQSGDRAHDPHTSELKLYQKCKQIKQYSLLMIQVREMYK